ncbi:B-box zinc finger family protein [Musa troglodytarum]|nr:B-box zinc finger family protein [Musa troglodytarum]
MKQRPACELCDGEAAVFCGPDAAFLCWACDASVHSANFLVARHVRRVACKACRSLDTARRVFGAAPRRVTPLCASCDPDPSPSSPSHSAVSSSSSSCLSTSESRVAHRAAKPAAPRRAAVKWCGRDADEGVGGVLLCWSRRMGLRSGRACMEVAARAVLRVRRGDRGPATTGGIRGRSLVRYRTLQGRGVVGGEGRRWDAPAAGSVLRRTREVHRRRRVTDRPVRRAGPSGRGGVGRALGAELYLVILHLYIPTFFC